MITVTRLDRSSYAINSDLIERISENPDTSLHMIDGKTYIVAESKNQVLELIARYRAYVLAIARDLTPAPDPAGRTLSVVRPAEDPHDNPAQSGARPPRK